MKNVKAIQGLVTTTTSSVIGGFSLELFATFKEEDPYTVVVEGKIVVNKKIFGLISTGKKEYLLEPKEVTAISGRDSRGDFKFAMKLFLKEEIEIANYHFGDNRNSIPNGLKKLGYSNRDVLIVIGSFGNMKKYWNSTVSGILD